MPPPTNAPLRKLENSAHCDQIQSPTLLVFLPGAYDKPEDYIKYQFVQEMRKRKLDVDVQLVDAHTAYYTEFSIVERLHQDVITPAISRGYRQIWLVGISLGGYGSSLYTAKHAEHITGMFLMAPFLGSRDIPASIRKDGGLRAWQAGELRPDDYDRKLWAWLQGYAAQRISPKLFVGYGETDRFAGSNQLLADVLPVDQSFVIAGGHDWATWQKLWQKFLDARQFQVISDVALGPQDSACRR